MHENRLWYGIFLALAFALLSSATLAGTVVIYAAVDLPVVEPLIADFEQTHPQIKVEYHDLQTTDLYQRFLREVPGGGKTDIVWSSAMDLQMKLVNDGHAKAHRSDETKALPAWAKWKDEAFGTTFEPVCFAYNSDLLPAEHVPQSHAEMARFLREHPERYRDRLVTYDPHRSGLGYLMHTQDLEANPVVFWNLIREMAQTGLSTEPTTSGMLDRIVSGKSTLGYNVLCSYTKARESADARLASVMPRDYTLVMSRIAFISRYAPHPEDARAWMDYLLSLRGQTVLNLIGLQAARGDVEGDTTAASLRKRLGSAFRPIALTTGLLTYVDKSKNELFLRHWDAALNTQRSAPSAPAASPSRTKSR